MTKTILSLATALVVAAGAFATAAEAGSCGGGGGYRNYGSSSYGRSASRSYSAAKYSKSSYAAASTASSSRKSAVAQAERDVKKPAPQSTASLASTPDKAEAIAERAVAALETTAEPVETNLARDLGCKRFIPAAGLTISVACGE